MPYKKKDRAADQALKEKLSAWLKGKRPESKARLSLGVEDVRRCVRGLQAAGGAADSLSTFARAILAARSARPSELERLRAFAQTFGVELSEEMARRTYDEQEVVNVYLIALRGEPVAESHLHWIANPDAPQRIWGWREPDARSPREPWEAIDVTTKYFGFKSPEACRKFLVRARSRLKGDRTGWRAQIDPSSFPLPQDR